MGIQPELLFSRRRPKTSEASTSSTRASVSRQVSLDYITTAGYARFPASKEFTILAVRRSLILVYQTQKPCTIQERRFQQDRYFHRIRRPVQLNKVKRGARYVIATNNITTSEQGSDKWKESGVPALPGIPDL